MAISATFPGADQRYTFDTERLKRPLLFSAICHGVLMVGAIVTAVRGHGESIWGENAGGGSAASVKLVSSASIPLPAPAVPTTNKLANDEPGLHYSEAVKPQPKQIPEKAIELPGRDTKRIESEHPELRQARQIHRFAQLPPPGPEIPYGVGGPATGPYGAYGEFDTKNGTGGFNFNNGDFGSRYGWYVTAIRGRISNNWLQATIDPNIRTAPRVYVAFQILRDGGVANTQITASSGVRSLDQSALRAVFDSNPMPPLPPDYRGSSVNVEFWFELHR